MMIISAGSVLNNISSMSETVVVAEGNEVNVVGDLS
jgi:hypothetical protein